MSLFNFTRCVSLSGSLGKADHSSITPFTTHLSPISQPMYLSSLAKWPHKESFTDIFLKLSKRIGVVNPFGYKPASSHLSDEFYYWAGSEVITDPIVCYEFEFCTIQLSWNQNYWNPISKATEVFDPSAKKELASKMFFKFNSNLKSIAYSFYGPGEHVVVFNRVQLASQTKFPNKLAYSKKGYIEKCDLMLNGAVTGVFGVKERPLANPI